VVRVARSSRGIHTIRAFGPFSVIHPLFVITLIAATYGLIATRQGRINAHRRTMIALFFGTLVSEGTFTLVPGRALHDVFFVAQ
jgi:uncharacterized membrane protein